jgi:hypothetical protein
MPEIRVLGVCERDVDLLLLEEFCSSPDFCNWFQKEIGVSTPGKLVSAVHSAVSVNGETDVDLTFGRAHDLVRVLVENKVDASFQHRQPERYHERRQQYQADDQFGEIVTVLVAPKRYLERAGSAAGFDFKLPYEAIAEWLKTNDYPDSRRQYKLAVLAQAIERSRNGYVHNPNDSVTLFWERYWQTVNQIAPELGLRTPGVKARNYIIDFSPPPLMSEKSTRLRHKLCPQGKMCGYIDLEFGNCTRDALAMRFPTNRMCGTEFVKAGKSAAVRLFVERIDMKQFEIDGLYENCAAAVTAGVVAARELLGWYLQQRQMNAS